MCNLYFKHLLPRVFFCKWHYTNYITIIHMGGTTEINKWSFKLSSIKELIDCSIHYIDYIAFSRNNVYMKWNFYFMCIFLWNNIVKTKLTYSNLNKISNIKKSFINVNVILAVNSMYTYTVSSFQTILKASYRNMLTIPQ